MYRLQDMYIEEFIDPIYSLDNFITAVKLCKLCSFDALSVSCYLSDNYQFYRYLNIDGLFIFFFLAKRFPHLYIVINGGSSLKSLQEYMTYNEETLEKLNLSIVSVFDTLSDYEYAKDLKIYCVGHSAAGYYASSLGVLLPLNSITIGQLPSVNSKFNPTTSVSFSLSGDLLCNQKALNLIKIKSPQPKNTLEGVINHSIDNYFKLINERQDLEVEFDQMNLPHFEEILAS